MSASSGNKPPISKDEALQLILSLAPKRDEAATRAAAERPFMLDRAPPLRRGTGERKRPFLLLKRALRRLPLAPFKSEALEAALSKFWSEHYAEEAQDAVRLAHSVDLSGCRLVVVSRFGVAPRKLIEGVVIGENGSVLHLSEAGKRRIYRVAKSGTVLRCLTSGIEFRRARWGRTET
jgi:hypothetical protein